MIDWSNPDPDPSDLDPSNPAPGAGLTGSIGSKCDLYAYMAGKNHVCSHCRRTTVHSEKDERWLWRAPVFGDFVVHCAVPSDSKLEKGSKKGTSTGVRTANVLLCKWSERPGFSWFLPNSVLWGQNLAEILFLLWLAFCRHRLQKHNWKSIPWGIAKNIVTKKFDPFMAKS